MTELSFLDGELDDNWKLEPGFFIDPDLISKSRYITAYTLNTLRTLDKEYNHQTGTTGRNSIDKTIAEFTAIFNSIRETPEPDHQKLRATLKALSDAWESTADTLSGSTAGVNKKEREYREEHKVGRDGIPEELKSDKQSLTNLMSVCSFMKGCFDSASRFNQ